MGRCGMAQIPEGHRPGPIFFHRLVTCFIPTIFPDMGAIWPAVDMEDKKRIRLSETRTALGTGQIPKFTSQIHSQIFFHFRDNRKSSLSHRLGPLFKFPIHVDGRDQDLPCFPVNILPEQAARFFGSYAIEANEKKIAPILLVDELKDLVNLFIREPADPRLLILNLWKLREEIDGLAEVIEESVKDHYNISHRLTFKVLCLEPVEEGAELHGVDRSEILIGEIGNKIFFPDPAFRLMPSRIVHLRGEVKLEGLIKPVGRLRFESRRIIAVLGRIRIIEAVEMLEEGVRVEFRLEWPTMFIVVEPLAAEIDPESVPVPVDASSHLRHHLLRNDEDLITTC